MKKTIVFTLLVLESIIGHSQSWTSPSSYERKTEYYNDELWCYYDKNGIIVKQTAVTTQDYGNYFRLTVFIANHSNQAILVDPLNVVATTLTNNGTTKELRTLSAQEYMNHVANVQGFTAGLYAFSQSMAASNAGYTTTTSTTYTSYNGYATAQAYGSVYSSNGSAYGSAYGYGSYHGLETSTTTTRSYDAAAAQRAQNIAQQNIASINNAFHNERINKRAQMLTKTTLYPGQYIIGYVYIKRRPRFKNMDNDVVINGAKYHFSWTWE